ncbi:malonyl-ACP O-methyltransferase BioC [Clostridium estertheticum]|uniref:Malonyl-[acyl-carrier protein] O-methyltransferase n=1 Tax=Clostridium estertheticum TaxID=238834 RepID=A0A5N7IJN5_9CLOT|nr:malonyl-ACP O-methyltransferase BioC [Clostridium estertheticum]MPQ30506.1 malonyl-ACP O-methyltransferase BioC [Clostridium estertheticum]MPQ61182.1 malonyl-ACP O-methyltransferase BioC [Clostridium estertheticum]
MIDKKQLKLHFSKNASNYDEYAHVQKDMKNSLVKFMMQNNKNNTEVKNILEIGCGTGYLTSTLIDLFPHSHITAVDIAPGMITEIKSKIKNDSVDFICGDLEEMNFNNTYDIIISNATFQWFNHIHATIEKLYALLNPKGILCFSTFGKHTFCELNECFKKVREELSIKESVYSGQSFYSLNELSTLCKEATKNQRIDDVLVEGKEKFEYEYFNNCNDFFTSIKKTGANNSNKDNKCTSLTFIKKVIKYYNKNFSENNKVKATYHCLFLKITSITL